MKKMIAFIALVIAVALTPAAGFAGTADILASLQTARAKAVALLGATDSAAQTALVADIKAATQDVDAKIAATLADAATSAAAKSKLADFQSVWTDFQKTRDTEVVPAVLAGDAAKAKGIAQGVQADRFKKMTALLQ